MCGRFTIAQPERVVATLAADDIRDDWRKPRYNIAPSQNAPVLLLRQNRRLLADLQWGLIPHWARDASLGARLINARAETAAEKPAFRDAFRSRRCLVPADGFFEWKRTAAGKTPFRIGFRDDQPFTMAGLYEIWRPSDTPPRATFTILTTTPNAVVAPIHNRMPVILPPDTWDAWLSPETTDPRDLAAILTPFDPVRMQAVPVSSHVNSPLHDDPACIRPITG